MQTDDPDNVSSRRPDTATWIVAFAGFILIALIGGFVALYIGKTSRDQRQAAEKAEAEERQAAEEATDRRAAAMMGIPPGARITDIAKPDRLPPGSSGTPTGGTRSRAPSPRELPDSDGVDDDGVIGIGAGGLGVREIDNLLFGRPSKAITVVLVCDASRAMMTYGMVRLKVELKKAINRLGPAQAFNIIFFNGEAVRSLSDDGVLFAVDANKRRALDFVDDVRAASGKADPVPALRLAFKDQPRQIYFLASGPFEATDAYAQILPECRRLNPGGKIRMDTILIDGRDAKVEESLNTLARETAGTYRLVSLNEQE